MELASSSVVRGISRGPRVRVNEDEAFCRFDGD